MINNLNYKYEKIKTLKDKKTIENIRIMMPCKLTPQRRDCVESTCPNQMTRIHIPNCPEQLGPAGPPAL
jgi:hypothetical protein